MTGGVQNQPAGGGAHLYPPLANCSDEQLESLANLMAASSTLPKGDILEAMKTARDKGQTFDMLQYEASNPGLPKLQAPADTDPVDTASNKWFQPSFMTAFFCIMTQLALINTKLEECEGLIASISNQVAFQMALAKADMKRKSGYMEVASIACQAAISFAGSLMAAQQLGKTTNVQNLAETEYDNKTKKMNADLAAKIETKTKLEGESVGLSSDNNATTTKSAEVTKLEGEIAADKAKIAERQDPTVRKSAVEAATVTEQNKIRLEAEMYKGLLEGVLTIAKAGVTGVKTNFEVAEIMFGAMEQQMQNMSSQAREAYGKLCDQVKQILDLINSAKAAEVQAFNPKA